MLELALKVNSSSPRLPTITTFPQPPMTRLTYPSPLGEVVRAEEILDLKSSLQSELGWSPRNPGVFWETWGPERSPAGQKSWPDYSKEFCPGGLGLLSPSRVIVSGNGEVPSEERASLLWISLVRAPLPAAKTEHFKTKYSVCFYFHLSLSVCLSHTVTSMHIFLGINSKKTLYLFFTRKELHSSSLIMGYVEHCLILQNRMEDMKGEAWHWREYCPNSFASMELGGLVFTLPHFPIICILLSELNTFLVLLPPTHVG